MRKLAEQCNGSTARVHNEPRKTLSATPAASPASAWQTTQARSRKLMSADAVENAELKTENAELKTENAELKTENAKLKSRLEACAKVLLDED